MPLQRLRDSITLISTFVLYCIIITEERRIAGAVRERVRSAAAPAHLPARRRAAERAHLVGVVERLVAEQPAQVPRVAVRRMTAGRILTDAVPVGIRALVTAAEHPHQHQL